MSPDFQKPPANSASVASGFVPVSGHDHRAADPDLAGLPARQGAATRQADPYGGFFYSKARDCSRCSTASLCLSKGRLNKELVISNEQPALLRARHRRERWSDEDQRLYQRHRWRSERFHGEAKAWRGLARAVRRGLPIENPFGRAGAMDVEPGRRVSL